MYLYVLLAFALLVGLRQPAFDPPWGGFWPAAGWAVGLTVGLILLAAALAAEALRRLQRDPGRPHDAQLFHHRSTLAIRAILLAGFAGLLYLTRWGAFFASEPFARIPGAGELLAGLPFFVTLVLTWLVQYRIDRALRQVAIGQRQWESPTAARVWSLGEYLLFNLRHQLLVIAVPMLLIVAAYDWVHLYEEALAVQFGAPWAADAVLACFSAGVFVIAPVMLRYLWPTSRLPDGPLRERLEALCGRLNLRCRDILVWHSGGMMVNAAVMGLFAPVRYVLLSDALLDAMDTPRIEAVFGHEVGHVRHRHIPYFVLFALASMFIVTAIMEVLAWLSSGPRAVLSLNLWAIEAIGVLCAVLIWGIGFGWVSRRFEWQADLFGARTVTPPVDDCPRPCSVHAAERPLLPAAVCATGAAIFASSLHRVARLNGIPLDERSWRHSSIGHRIRRLVRLASDPLAATKFDRQIQRIKFTLIATVVLGGLAGGLHYLGDRAAQRVDRRPALVDLPERAAVDARVELPRR